MNRWVEPEWLDALPAKDPSAIGSRRDLRRLNKWMGNASIMVQTLGAFSQRTEPMHLVELGAGDGCFLLSVARLLGPSWKGTQATLVDRQNFMATETVREFGALGWKVEVVACDVFDWCKEGPPQPRCVVLANLFLHHFETASLTELLRGIARRSMLLVAVEPRRSSFALACSRLLWFIGCNNVTRHDAPVSVRAGFSGQELSQLWDIAAPWALREQPQGPFSHLFVARAPA
jgi:hypothetical protein